MRVDPNHQRRGYGERILVALEDRAKEREFERIFLDTNEHLTAARKLYEKHGYEESHRETRPATGVEFIYCRKDL